MEKANNLICQVRWFFIFLACVCVCPSSVNAQWSKYSWLLTSTVNIVEEILLSRDCILVLVSNTGIGFGMLAGKNKSKSAFDQFLFSLNMHCQACGIRIARSLLCKVLFVKVFSSNAALKGEAMISKTSFIRWGFLAVLLLGYQRPGHHD